jgi:hypothetical protein
MKEQTWTLELYKTLQINLQNGFNEIRSRWLLAPNSKYEHDQSLGLSKLVPFSLYF